MRVKVLDANGRGSRSDVTNAIEFATANKAALDIDIIKSSSGTGTTERQLFWCGR